MKLCSVTAALAVAAASPAAAQPLLGLNYGQINLGAGVAGQTKGKLSVSGYGSYSDDEDLKTGWLVSGLVGRRLQRGFSLEAEALYVDNGIKTGDLNSYAGTDLKARTRAYGALANLKLEAPAPYRFWAAGPSISPYVAAGLGYGGVKYKAAGYSDSDEGLMWQLKAGLAFHASPRLTWDLGYRYLRTPQYEVSDSTYGADLKIKTGVHAISLGARFGF